MASVGSLIANLGLDTARFEAGIKNTERSLRRFARRTEASLNKINRRAGNVATAMTVAFTAAFGAMVKRSIDLGDQLAKLETRLGVSVEAMSGLKFAAEQSGVAFATFSMGLQRMIRRVGEAANGTGEAEAAIIELGLSAKKLAQLAPEDQFRAIAQRLSEVGNANDRARLAMKMFDSEGVALLQMMENGSAGIDEMVKKAEELGIVFSQKTALGAQEAKNAMGEAKAVINAAAMEAAINLIPAITDLSRQFADALPAGIQGAVNAFYTLRVEGLRVLAFLVKNMATVADAISEMFDGSADAAQQRISEVIARITELEAKQKQMQEAGARGRSGAFGAIANEIARLKEELETLEAGDTLGQQANSVRTTLEMLEAALLKSATRAEVVKTQIAGVNTEITKVPVEKIDDVNSAFGKVSLSMAQTIASMKSLGETIQVDIFDKSQSAFSQMRDGFKSALRDMVNAWINSGLQNIFNVGADAAGGFLSGIFGNFLPKMQNGGSFMVGGSGGTDSNVVAFRATRGETVNIGSNKFAGGNAGASQPIVIYNNYDFQGSSVSQEDVRMFVDASNKKLRADLHKDLRRRKI